MKKFPLLLFVTLLLIISCKKIEQKQTIINGNIPNLPDGTLYLFEEDGTNKIDSLKIKNGKFKFIYKWKNEEPVYLGLHLKDITGVYSMIGFPTHSKYKGAPLMQSVFYSDENINIKGEIFDNTPTNFPKTVKSVDLKEFISAGKQTEALYNVDGDLFEKITDKTVPIVTKKIKQYPDSYYLLYMIAQNKNSFAAQQVNDYLNLFKGEITESDSYRKLFKYNEKRLKTKTATLPLLEDDKGVKIEILNKNYKKHLIIFWASWCGPCRAEIPLLKKIYATEKNNVEFISISTDENKNEWNKALKYENMDWKQLLVDKKDPSYENLQIQLKLNSAIPYTVLVDNNLKILASSVGLSSEEELIQLINSK